MKKLLIILIGCVLSVSYANTICKLPQPTNIAIVNNIIEGSIDQSVIDCLTNNIENSDAQFLLGVFYLHGLGVDMNLSKGFEYIKKAAEKNHKLALFEMGGYFEKGVSETELVVNKNIDLALDFYVKSAMLESVEAMNSITRILLFLPKSKQTEKAFYWAKKSANNGNIYGLHNLGIIYQFGLAGAKVNLRKSFDYFLEASELGLSSSQINLSLLYISKEPDIQYDEEKAFYWAQRASDQNNFSAYNILGVFYAKGIGTEKNDKKACTMFHKAAKNNEVNAQINLAIFYEKGIGCDKSINDAYFWYDKALVNIDPNYVNIKYEVPMDDIKKMINLSLKKLPTNALSNKIIDLD